MNDSDDCQARWDALRQTNPGIDERISEKVSTFGPIPEPAMRLWKAAKLHHFQLQQQRFRKAE